MKMMRAISTCLLALGMLCGSFSDSWAIPNLQIYIPGATYDTATETWIINSYEYELWVIGANIDVLDVKFAAAVPTDEDGTINVEWLDPGAADYGTSNVSSITLDEAGGMAYENYQDSYDGADPEPNTYAFVEDDTPIMGSGKDVPGGGVFPTDFYEYFVGDFGTDETVQNYLPGDEWGDTAAGDIKKFDIRVQGYSWVDIVAYDHVILSNNKAKYVVTPYSHDGSSALPVPEPSTLLLVGSGLIGMVGLGKRMRRQRP